MTEESAEYIYSKHLVEGRDIGISYSYELVIKLKKVTETNPYPNLIIKILNLSTLCYFSYEYLGNQEYYTNRFEDISTEESYLKSMYDQIVKSIKDQKIIIQDFTNSGYLKLSYDDTRKDLQLDLSKLNLPIYQVQYLFRRFKEENEALREENVSIKEDIQQLKNQLRNIRADIGLVNDNLSHANFHYSRTN